MTDSDTPPQSARKQLSLRDKPWGDRGLLLVWRIILIAYLAVATLVASAPSVLGMTNEEYTRIGVALAMCGIAFFAWQRINELKVVVRGSKVSQDHSHDDG